MRTYTLIYLSALISVLAGAFLFSPVDYPLLGWALLTYGAAVAFFGFILDRHN